MTSQLYSQKVSSDTCCVPCVTLKKALIVKSEKEYVQKQLVYVRDSIQILQEIITSKDTIIDQKDSIINIYRLNEVRYQQIIYNKDGMIKAYQAEVERQRKGKKLAYLLGILTTISTLLVTL